MNEAWHLLHTAGGLFRVYTVLLCRRAVDLALLGLGLTLLISALEITLSLQMSAEHPGPGFMRITGVELGFVRFTGPWLTLSPVLFLAAALGFGWSGLRMILSALRKFRGGRRAISPSHHLAG